MTADGQRPPAEWGEPRTKTITWFDWHANGDGAGALSGLQFIEGIRDGRFPPPPAVSVIGARLVSVGDGEAVFRCAPDGSFLNTLGLVHGGFVSLALDTAMGVATTTKSPAGVGYASIELKVSFLKPIPADGGEIEVRGRVLRFGRRIAFAEAHAYTADGALAAHATSSLAAVGSDLLTS